MSMVLYVLLVPLEYIFQCFLKKKNENSVLFGFVLSPEVNN